MQEKRWLNVLIGCIVAVGLFTRFTFLFLVLPAALSVLYELTSGECDVTLAIELFTHHMCTRKNAFEATRSDVHCIWIYGNECCICASRFAVLWLTDCTHRWHCSPSAQCCSSTALTAAASFTIPILHSHWCEGKMIADVRECIMTSLSGTFDTDTVQQLDV